MPELLQEWVTLQAERRPETVAVVGTRDAFTYGRLEALSNQLARVLRDNGCKKGEPVCLLMPKSPTAIACLLGIYKAGCIYVPLDPSSPPARLGKIVESCGNRWILAAGSVSAALGELSKDPQYGASLRVGWVDEELSAAGNFEPAFTLIDARQYPAAPLGYQTERHDPAHILFTSGSTGVPKGVVITHANVIHFIEWACEYFGIRPSDRTSGHSPLHFDLSVFDIFGAFAAGAQLHLVPPDLNVLPNRLAEFIRSSELTQWFSVPSVLNYMAKFDVVRFGDFPAVKRVLWCGEVFPTPGVIYWMKRLPHATFTNLYGPTETTIASSYYTVPGCPEDERAAIPIGSACPGEELLVLDERLCPAPPGEAGELYIRGVGLSPGYWRDAEQTARAFLQNPHSADPNDRIYRTGDRARIGEDGLVYFLGRTDSQVKSRGYRIELGEVEAALNALDWLQECAVVAIPTDGFEGAMICCAYAASGGRAVAPAELRKELAKRLPGYMLPSRWMCLDRLPHNANGKIDRRTLKEEFQRHAAQAT